MQLLANVGWHEVDNCRWEMAMTENFEALTSLEKFHMTSEKKKMKKKIDSEAMSCSHVTGNDGKRQGINT